MNPIFVIWLYSILVFADHFSASAAANPTSSSRSRFPLASISTKKINDDEKKTETENREPDLRTLLGSGSNDLSGSEETDLDLVESPREEENGASVDENETTKDKDSSATSGVLNFFFGVPTSEDFEEMKSEQNEEEEEEEEDEESTPAQSFFRRFSSTENHQTEKEEVVNEGTEEKAGLFFRRRTDPKTADGIETEEAQGSFLDRLFPPADNVQEPYADEDDSSDQQNDASESFLGRLRSMMSDSNETSTESSSDGAQSEDKPPDSAKPSFFNRLSSALGSNETHADKENEENSSGGTTESKSSSLFEQSQQQDDPTTEEEESIEEEAAKAGSPRFGFRKIAIEEDEDDESYCEPSSSETSNPILRFIRPPPRNVENEDDHSVDEKVPETVESGDADDNESTKSSTEAEAGVQQRSIFQRLSNKMSDDGDGKRKEPEATILQLKLDEDTESPTDIDSETENDGDNAPSQLEPDTQEVDPEDEPQTVEIERKEQSLEESTVESEAIESRIDDVDSEEAPDKAPSAPVEDRSTEEEQGSSDNETKPSKDENEATPPRAHFWQPRPQTGGVPGAGVPGVIVMNPRTGPVPLHGPVYAGGVPVQQDHQHAATRQVLLEVIGSILGTALRLWYLTYLTRKLATQDERIRPAQHFVWERLNDRHSRDAGALQRSVDSPPLGVKKGVWYRRHIRKLGRFRRPAQDLEKTFSTTVVVWDIVTDSGTIDVDHIAEVVTFLIDRHKQHSFGTDKETGEACPLEVVLNIKSGGGGVTSFGLASAHIQRLSNVQGIETTACVDEYAASGGYMIASQAHRILAAPFATVGSIGVIMETLNFNHLLKRYGVRPTILKSGKSKNPISPFGENTVQDLNKEKKVLNKVHKAFRNLVVSARPSLAESLESTADGSVFLGLEALENNLVDTVMTSSEYIALNIAAGNRVLKLHRAQFSSLANRLHLSPLELLPHMKSWFKNNVMDVKAEKRVVQGLQAATIVGLVRQFVGKFIRNSRY